MSENIKFEGFNRIVIDHDGQAVPPSRAYAMGIKPDVGFMRGDGWSLGAPEELEDVAHRMWITEWTHIIRRDQTEWQKL